MTILLIASHQLILSTDCGELTPVDPDLGLAFELQEPAWLDYESVVSELDKGTVITPPDRARALQRRLLECSVLPDRCKRLRARLAKTAMIAVETAVAKVHSQYSSSWRPWEVYLAVGIAVVISVGSAFAAGYLSGAL